MSLISDNRPDFDQTNKIDIQKHDQSKIQKTGELESGQSVTKSKNDLPESVPNKLQKQQQSTASIKGKTEVIKEKGLLAKFLSIFKPKEMMSIEKNLPEMINEPRIDSEEIFKIVSIVSKKLKPTESSEISIPSLKNHKFILLKDKNSKIDLIIQEKLLGKGGSGEVFKAISVMTKEDIALKYAQLDRSSQEELKNEVEMLEILNKNGPKEGIQSLIKVTKMEKDGVTQTVTRGKVYSNGDMQKEVELLRFAKMFGVNPKEISKMSEKDLKEMVQKKAESFEKDLSNLVNRKNDILAEKKEGYQKEIQTMNREIKNLVANNTKVLGQSVYLSFLGMDKAMAFLDQCDQFLQELQGDEKIDISKQLETFFTPALLDAAKKSQTVPYLNFEKKAALASNVLAGMRHIHKNGIVHGDIKPLNFFWNDKEAVIADFGGSQSKIKPSDVTTTPLYGGGPYKNAMKHYLKSDQKDNWHKVGQALDTKAMGLSLYELFTGNALPDDDDNPKTYERMESELIKEGLEQEAAKIIIKMAKPITFDIKNAPNPFPLPVTDQELAQLQKLLA